MPGVGLVPTEAPDKDQVGRALSAARKSTASMGTFTEKKLPKEKAAKNLGRKRKVFIITSLHTRKMWDVLQM